MVAIVTGNHLGFFASSVMGQSLNGWGAGSAQGLINRLGINVATGNLVLQGRDEHLASMGPELSLLRTYNSLGLRDDDNGDNWTFGNQQRLIQLSGVVNTVGSTIVRVSTDGARQRFTFDADLGQYRSVDGAGAHDQLSLLTDEGGQWTGAGVWLEAESGRTEHYDTSSRLTKQRDRNGNETLYSYVDNRLTEIRAGQQALRLGWAGNNLTEIRALRYQENGIEMAQEQVRYRYVYDAQNRLERAQVDLTPDIAGTEDGKIYETIYQYDGDSSRLASLLQSDGTALYFSYELVQGSYRIKTLTDGENRTLRFDYNLAEQRTDISDAFGLVTSYFFDDNGNVIKVMSPAVNGQRMSNAFAYDADGNLIHTTDGLGRTVTYGYDRHGNQILQRDAAGNTITRQFNAAQQLIAETAYVIADPDGAGEAKAAQPITQRYVYSTDGKERLLYALTAEGRVTEHSYDAFGQLTQTRSFIRSRYNTASLAFDAVPSQAEMASWVDQLADKSDAQVIQYDYDFRGQLRAKTTFSKADVVGNGSGTVSTAHYVYDQYGRLIQVVDPRGVATTEDQTDYITHYTYDGLNRLVSTVDAKGNTSLTTYDTANRRMVMQSAAGLITTSVFDRSGRLISFTQADRTGQQAGTTQYLYDEAGNLRATQDPTGARDYQFYDHAKRVIAKVNSTGAVTELVYDQAGQLISEIQYATRVNTQNWLQNGVVTTRDFAAIRPQAHAADRRSHQVFDQAGRLLRRIDAAGVVTENRYDGTGRLISTIQYSDEVHGLDIQVDNARLHYSMNGTDQSGTDAADYLFGQAGNNKISGGAGNDEIRGGTGADELRGGNDHDWLMGEVGDDRLYGEAGDDILDGDSGDDTLEGGSGNDVYRFSRGWGRDSISNNDSTAGRRDVIEFVDMTSAEVVLRRDSYNRLLITSADGNDQITVSNFFIADGANSYLINELRFADGTVWDLAAIKQAVLAATGSDDTIYAHESGDVISSGGANDVVYAKGGDDIVDGGAGNDNLQGEAGNDTLLGNVGDDTLNGGAGNDILEGGVGNETLDGGAGSDTYRFSAGWGRDTISNSDSSAGRKDVVEFLAGIATSDIRVIRSSNNLLLERIGSDDRISVVNHFSSTTNAINEVRFADGTVWNQAELLSRATAYVTPTAQTLNGDTTDNTISAGAGNDTLSGKDGNDELSGQDGNDTLYGDNGDDALLGGAGDDTLYSNDGNDVLDGGSGNDSMTGGTGTDIYRFSAGWGRDNIHAHDNSSARQNKIIEFTAGIAPEEIQLRRGSSSSNELVIEHIGTGDRIDVSYHFHPTNASYKINEIRFADGTVWTEADINQRVAHGTDGGETMGGGATDDVIYGHQDKDTLYGQDGNDQLEGGWHNDTLYGGNGNDTLLGQEGDDTLNGDAGNDVLEGGSGNDSLTGGVGNDSYRFSAGWGRDTINTYDTGSNRKDVIEFTDDVTAAEVRLRRYSNDLIIERVGSDDRIAVSNHFNSNIGYRLNEIRFADGTVWTEADINLRITESTAGDETLDGTASADVMVGGQGKDILRGEAGDDTLSGGWHDDTLNGDIGNDTLLGQEGADTLNGDAGNDTLDGGSGNDTLDGGTGNDRYRFSAGWGQDVINNYDTSSGRKDVIEFAADVTAGEIRLRRYSNDLIIERVGSDDRITVSNHFNSNIGYRLNEIRFVDGTVWTETDINLRIVGSTDGGETLYGSAGADAIAGGQGNDTLWGREGNDRIEGGWHDDTLFGEAGDDVLLGQEGSDTLNGDVGNDTLDGGSGNDTLDAGTGNDRYRFSAGWGQDVINNYDTSSGRKDVIEFAAGVTAGEIRLRRSNSYDALIIERAGSDDRIEVRYHFQQSNYKINEIRFADGTVWTDADINLRITESSTGDDTLHGTASVDVIAGGQGNDALNGREGNDQLAGGWHDDTLFGEAGDDVLLGQEGSDTLNGDVGNDTLDGGSGNDTLDAGTGNDRYRFSAGWGQDVINNYDTSSGRKDVIEFAAGVTAGEIRLRRSNSYDALIIERAGSDDRIEVRYHFQQSNYKINEIRFADGTVWTDADINLRITESSTGDDTLYGTASVDVIAGGQGNDLLYGMESNDVLHGGEHSDTLYGGAGNDILDGGSEDDFLQGEAGNDCYRFSAGWGHDTVNAYDTTGGRKETIEFASGILPADIRLWRSPNYDPNSLFIQRIAGNDWIRVQGHFSGSSYAINEIRFADGTLWTSTNITAQVQQLSINWGAISSESASTINGYGTVTGTARKDTINLSAASGNVDGGDGNDVINGSYGVDVIAGGTGNDQIRSGTGNDSLFGGIGNDSLYGDAGDDLLDGGSGDDNLNGGAGNDTYRFSRGFGYDSISNNDSTVGRRDIITFTDLLPGDVVVRRDASSNLLLHTADGTDRLTVTNYFGADGNTAYVINEVHFADGTIWDVATVKAKALQHTDRNDSIHAFDSDDVIAAGGNDDSVYGKGGSDQIDGEAGHDQLHGDDGNDTLLGGIGNDSLYGDAGDDLLDGGSGDDNLNGGAGNDTYRFSRGFGRDNINNNDSTVGRRDIITFTDLLPGDVVVRRDASSNLLLHTADGTDRLTVTNYFGADGNSSYVINEIQFADGTVWDVTTVKAKALQHTARNDDIHAFDSDDVIAAGGNDDSVYGKGGSDQIDGEAGHDQLHGDDGNDTLLGGIGNDQLDGDAGDDLLDGGSGDDNLNGGAGSDTYRFSRGFGRDSISNNDSTVGRSDVIEFTDLLAGDVVLTRGTSDQLFIDVATSGDRLTVYSHFSSNSNCQINAIRFADGTVWDSNEIQSRIAMNRGEELPRFTGGDLLNGANENDVLVGSTPWETLNGSSGNDELVGGEGADQLAGGDGADTLEGGIGNDALTGNAGNDVYRFAPGFGEDIINAYDTGANRTEVIEFLAGIKPANILLSRRANDLIVERFGTGDRVTVRDHFRNSFYSINEIRFADGTTWGKDEIKNHTDSPRYGDYQRTTLSWRDAVRTTDVEQYDTTTTADVGLFADHTLQTVNGQWTIQNGAMTGLNAGLVHVGSSDWQNYVASVDVNLATVTTEASLLFRYVDANNYHALSLKQGSLRLLAVRNGVISELATAVVAVQANRPVSLKVAVDGDRAVAYLNNQQQLVAAELAQAKGAVGLQVHNAGTVTFDNLTVMSAADQAGAHTATTLLRDALSGASTSNYPDVYVTVDDRAPVLVKATEDGQYKLDLYQLEAGTHRYVMEYRNNAGITFRRAEGYFQVSENGSEHTVAMAVSTKPEQAARSTRLFYSETGLVTGKLDAEGYLTEFRYDAAGNLLETVAYATQVNAALQASAGLDALRPAADVADQHSYQLYDNQGRLIASVDAEGYLTEQQYDVAGQIVARIRYSTRVNYTVGQSLENIRPTPQAADQSTTYTFNELGQVITEALPNGSIKRYSYDAAGNVIRVEQQDVSSVELRARSNQFSDKGELVIETDALSNEVRHQYDVAGRRLSTTDAAGNKTFFFYDEAQRLRFTVNELGEVRERIYSTFGELTDTVAYSGRIDTSGLQGGSITTELSARVTAIADASRDALAKSAYDVRGQLQADTDANGTRTERVRSAFGEVIEQTGTRTTRFEYDQRGVLLATTDAVGVDGVEQTTSHTVDAFGRVTERRDGAGNTTRTEYDRLGRQLVREDATGANTRLVYDAFDRVMEQHDALGNITQYRYDDETRLLEVTTPEGIITQTFRSAFGETVRVLDGNGIETRYEYDANGNLDKIYRADVLQADHDYDQRNNRIRSTDAVGRVTEFHYDAVNRLASRVVDPAGLALTSTYNYDGQGRQVEVAEGDRITVTGYDPKGQVTRVEIRNAQRDLITATEYRYDAAGNKTRVVNGAGLAGAQTTDYVYDARNRLSQTIVDPAGLKLTTRYEYDAADNLIKVTDGNGNATRHIYNSRGEKLYTIDAEGGVSEFQYDANGQRTHIRQYAQALNLDNWLAALPAERNGVPTEADVSAALVADDVNDVRSWHVRDADGRLRYQLQALNESEVLATETRYDHNGNAIATVRYRAPINLSALNVAAVDGLTADEVATQISPSREDKIEFRLYDAQNRVRYIVRGNEANYVDGALSQLSADIEQLEYDNAGQIRLQHRYATARTVRADELSLVIFETSHLTALRADEQRTNRMAYDAAGRLVYSVDALGYVTENRYTTNGQLESTRQYRQAIAASVEASVSAIKVALVGNTDIRHTTYQYDAAGRLLSVSDAEGYHESYGYDGVGNRTRRTDKNANNWFSRYDAAGRLIEEEAPETDVRLRGSNVPSARKLVTRYSYDGTDRVISRTTAYGTTDAQVTSYALDKLGRQTYISGTQDQRYVYDAFGRVKTRIDGLGNEVHYDYDAVGRQLVTRDAKGTRERKVYDAFGRVLEQYNGLNQKTTYQYDEATRQLITTTPEGIITRATRNAHGEVISQIDGNGIETRYEYDSKGQLDKVYRNNVLQSDADYDEAGNRIRSTDANGVVTEYRFDAVNRLLKRTIDARTTANPDGLNLETVYRYDPVGRQTETEEGNRLSINIFNDAGQLIRIETRSLSRELMTATDYQYDAQGNRVRVIVGAGMAGAQTTDYVYDARNRLSQTIVDPAGLKLTTRYEYDAADNLVKVTDGNGGVTRHVYNARHEKLYTLDPEGGVVAVRYDDNGRQIGSHRYALRVDLPGLLNALPAVRQGILQAEDVAPLVVADAAHDQREWQVLDADGRSRFQIQAVDATWVRVSEQQLDGNGNVTASVRYAERVSLSALQAHATDGLTVTEVQSLLTVSERDQVLLNFYDANNRIRYTVQSLQVSYDGQGKRSALTAAVRQFNYDAVGNSTGGMEFASVVALDLSQPVTVSRLDTQLALDHGNPENRSTRHEYDAAGRLRFTANALGQVLEQQYDANGNVVLRRQYAHTVMDAELPSSVLADNTRDRTERSVYDAAGRLRYQIDSLNHVIELQYDASNQLTLRTRYANPIALPALLTEANMLVAISASNPFTWLNRNDQIDYDKAGRVTRTVDGNGLLTRSYDATGRLKALSGARTESYSYDAAGYLIATTDALGRTERYTVDALGNRTSFINKRESIWDYDYDALGRLIEEITPEVAVEPASGQMPTSRRLVTQLNYDVFGNVTRRHEGILLEAVSGSRNEEQSKLTQYEYDSFNRQTRIIDGGYYHSDTGRFERTASDGAVRRVTTATYDTFGNIVKTEIAVGAVAIVQYKVYDKLGRVIYEIDPANHVTHNSYDALGNLSAVTRLARAMVPSQNVSAQTFHQLNGWYRGSDFFSLLSPSTDDRSVIMSYDRLGQKTSVRQILDPAMQYERPDSQPETTFIYNAFGDVVREGVRISESQWAYTHSFYNDRGWKVGTVDAEGYYTGYSYGPDTGWLGRITEYATPVAVSDTTYRDGFNGLQNSVGTDRITEFQYDAMGRKLAIHRHGLTYATWNALTKQYDVVSNATLKVWEGRYDTLGNLTNQYDADDHVTSMTYDDLGRIITQVAVVRNAAGESVNPFESNRYAGLVTSFAYNALGQITTEIRDPTATDGGVVTRYEYDAHGNQVSVKPDEQSATTKRYDVFGRLVQEKTGRKSPPPGGVPSQIPLVWSDRRYQYDAAGRQTATLDVFRTKSGALRYSGNVVAFNAFGEVTEEMAVAGNVKDELDFDKELGQGTRSQRVHYHYDNAGRITYKIAGDGKTDYDYDLAGRAVRQAQLGDLNSASDNRVTETVYDNLGRMTIQRLPRFDAITTPLGAESTAVLPVITQKYDRWGNIIERTDAHGQVTRYAYNHDNQLISEALPTVTAVGTDGLAFQASVVHKFQYDAQGRMVEEQDWANGTRLRTRRKEYNEAGELVAQTDATGARSEYRYDIRGNRVASKNAMGVVSTNAFDKAGNVVRQGLLRTVNGNVEDVALLTYSYDGLNRKVSETDAYGYSKIWQYDERGLVTASISAAGVRTDFTYDDYGNKVEQLDGIGGTRRWEFSDGLGSDAGVYVFGQLKRYTDLGGHVTSYHYDALGQLQREDWSVPAGASTEYVGGRTYRYHTNGLLAEVRDELTEGERDGLDDRTADYLYTIETTSYDYTIAGQRAREIHDTIMKEERLYSEPEPDGGSLDYMLVDTSHVRRESRFAYDEHGRLQEVVAPTGTRLLNGNEASTAQISSLRYGYDELGNRRHVHSIYNKAGGSAQTTDHWYLYDMEGRVTLSQGTLKNGQIQMLTGDGNHGVSVRITYDVLGRRLSAETYTGYDEDIDYRFHGTGGYVADRWNIYKQELYSYNDQNLLTAIQSRTLLKEFQSNPNRVDYLTLRDVSRRDYDLRGFQLKSSTFNGDGNFSGATTTEYDADGKQLLQQNFDANNKLKNRIRFNDAGSYDSAGNLKQYVYEQGSMQRVPDYDFSSGEIVYGDDGEPLPSGFHDEFIVDWSQTYTYTYGAQYDSYQATYVNVHSTQGGGVTDGYTRNRYDARGRLVSTEFTQNDSTIWRTFSHDRDGRILTKTERKDGGTLKAQDYYYADGKPIASIGTISERAGEFDYNYTPVSEQYPSQAPGSYVVNAGDTLAHIAQAVWGDAKLWYLIADANSLSLGPDDVLSDGEVGTSLRIPNVISNIHNDAETFKPYNASEVIGDTTPTPVPPPPPKDKCKVLSAIIGIVVAIIVTVYSGGNAAAGAAAGNNAAQVSSAMLNDRYDYGAWRRQTLNPFSGDRSGLGRTMFYMSSIETITMGGAWYWSDNDRGNGVDTAIWNPLEAGMEGSYDRQSTAISAAAGYVGGAVGGAVSGGTYGAVAGAAASYTTAYALNKAMGREAHFSLRELGANMAAAYLSSELMGGEPVANNDGTTTTTAAAQVRPFEWSNVLVDVMQNVAHSGIQYFVSKAFNVKDTHWDGKFALASAAASSLGNNYVGDWKYDKLPETVKAAMATNPHAGDEYYKQLADWKEKGLNTKDAEALASAFASRDVTRRVAGRDFPGAISDTVELGGTDGVSFTSAQRAELAANRPALVWNEDDVLSALSNPDRFGVNTDNLFDIETVLPGLDSLGAGLDDRLMALQQRFAEVSADEARAARFAAYSRAEEAELAAMCTPENPTGAAKLALTEAQRDAAAKAILAHTNSPAGLLENFGYVASRPQQSGVEKFIYGGLQGVNDLFQPLYLAVDSVSYLDDRVSNLFFDKPMGDVRYYSNAANYLASGGDNYDYALRLTLSETPPGMLAYGLRDTAVSAYNLDGFGVLNGVAELGLGYFGVRGMGGVSLNDATSTLRADLYDLSSRVYQNAGIHANRFGTGEVGGINLDAFRATNNVIDLTSGELAPGLYRANPQQIRFGQHVASPNFSNGGTINDTIAELLAGKSPDQIGSPIRVIYRDDVPFTLDNRRLIAFNAAGVDSIPIQVVSAGDPAIATLLRNPTRMNPIAGEGRYIIVTPKVDQQSARQLLLENGLIKE